MDKQKEYEKLKNVYGENEYQNWLDSLEVGDTVCFEYCRTPPYIRLYVGKISEISRTRTFYIDKRRMFPKMMIVAYKSHDFRSNGRMIGNIFTKLQPYTEEIQSKIKLENTKIRTKKLIKKFMTKYKKAKYTQNELDKINECLQEILGIKLEENEEYE